MDLSDPDVIRVGDNYYMTISSFNMMPGLPIYHSKDLVNWRQLTYALKEHPRAHYTYKNRSADQLDYDKPRPSKGVWAPSFEYHDGHFWIYWGDPDAGVYMVKAKSPEGPWDEPILVHKAKGWIDPSVVWDTENKKAYMVHAFANSRVGFHSVLDVMELSYDGTRVIGDSVRIYDAKQPEVFPSDREHRIIEGPKFDKFGDWYYILAPAGGVEAGWQVALRSKNPMGPYEVKTVGETGDTNINGPHQGSLLQSHTGEWWFIHFQSAGTLGRITRLEPASWRDGWPITGVDTNGDGIGHPVESYRYPHKPSSYSLNYSDSFDAPTLGLQWQWPANPKEGWYSMSNGELVLPALFDVSTPLETVPHVLNQMFPSANFSATAHMSLDGSTNVRGSLITLGRKAFEIGVESDKDSSNSTVSVKFNGEALASDTFTAKEFWLRLDTEGEIPTPLVRKKHVSIDSQSKAEGDQAPHEYLDLDRWENGVIYGRFSYSTDGKTYVPLGEKYILRSGWWSGVRLGFTSLKLDSNSQGGVTIKDVEIELRGD
jgi:beta-xylosidase